MEEPSTFPAVQAHHGALPGLPQRPPEAFCLDGEGVLFVANWAMMNLVNLLSLEFFLLWTSSKIETCSISCVIVDVWECTIWLSVLLEVCPCTLVTMYCLLAALNIYVLSELIAVLMVESESIIDSSLTLIFWFGYGMIYGVYFPVKGN